MNLSPRLKKVDSTPSFLNFASAKSPSTLVAVACCIASWWCESDHALNSLSWQALQASAPTWVAEILLGAVSEATAEPGEGEEAGADTGHEDTKNGVTPATNVGSTRAGNHEALGSRLRTLGFCRHRGGLALGC